MMYGYLDKTSIKKKTAHWIHLRENDPRYTNGYKILSDCKCSACGFLVKREKEKCPHCGAVMSGARE